MGLFDGLHIGYSGLNASQAGITTTSHNISNANTDGYSRQRINQHASVPLHSIPGDVGRGVTVDSINRVHNEFVFKRYLSSGAKLEKDTFTKETLTEISSYFPDLEDKGIGSDLKAFFKGWSDVALNPSDSSQKVILAESAKALSRDIQDTKARLGDLQSRLDDQLGVAVDEVNRIGKEIATINKEINKVESDNRSHANDLRDRRDSLELRLSKLVGANVYKGRLHSHSDIDRAQTDQGSDYNINIAGRNLVDGGSFHPIKIDSSGASATAKFSAIYYVANDNSNDRVDITSQIHGGKIGAILALKGDGIDQNGHATNSKIQRYIDQLDNFAKGLIEGVNSIYAQSPQTSLQSRRFEGMNEATKLTTIDGIHTGDFDVVVYGKDGSELARRTIKIDEDTVVEDPNDPYANAIINQINANKDDNSDNDGTNDVDDYYKATFGDRAFSFKPLVDGVSIAIEDHGSNFAGVSAINRFFEGESASDIDLTYDLKEHPENISANAAPVEGNNEVANKMVAFEFTPIAFKVSGDRYTSQTAGGFYRDITAGIASDAAQAIRTEDASKVLNSTIEQQQQSVSGVDMDEELVMLMKYQTAYQANAKVISAVDKMVDTLLGIR